MSTYYIHEANIEKLEKKLQTIQKKCNKYQLNFKYERIGEDIQEAEDQDGNKYYTKYIIVDVEGSVTHGEWRFAATIDHHEKGNIIRAFDTELEIPERYMTCGPTCEHCNKIRSRKDTYLVYNDSTHEFKQLGKNCMNEYTNGLDAESVAAFCQMFEELEESYSYGGFSYTRYMNVEETLRFAFECFRHFGYEKAYDEFGDRVYTRTTRERVSDYMCVINNTGWMSAQQKEVIRQEMDEVGFNPNSEYAVKSTADAMEWIKTQDDPSNHYLFSLNIICSAAYQEYRNFGMLVSMPIAYDRHLKDIAYQEKKKAERAADPRQNSQYIGEVGDKLEMTCKNFELIKAFDSDYGMSWLYTWTDENNNVFTWYSSKPIDLDNIEVTSIKGTVKAHNEFRGINQTAMTRCKVNP